MLWLYKESRNDAITHYREPLGWLNRFNLNSVNSVSFVWLFQQCQSLCYNWLKVGSFQNLGDDCVYYKSKDDITNTVNHQYHNRGNFICLIPRSTISNTASLDNVHNNYKQVSQDMPDNNRFVSYLITVKLNKSYQPSNTPYQNDAG
jgi:hypothetical protein